MAHPNESVTSFVVERLKIKAVLRNGVSLFCDETEAHTDVDGCQQNIRVIRGSL
jgi:hypothetical protein